MDQLHFYKSAFSSGKKKNKNIQLEQLQSFLVTIKCEMINWRKALAMDMHHSTMLNTMTYHMRWSLLSSCVDAYLLCLLKYLHEMVRK